MHHHCETTREEEDDNTSPSVMMSFEGALDLPMCLPSYVPETTNRNNNNITSSSSSSLTFSFEGRNFRERNQTLNHNSSSSNCIFQNEQSTNAADEFRQATGGLTLDVALLAKLSGGGTNSMELPDQITTLVSRPDILAIYQKLQEEDERKRIRLARNRSSARVRRQKKKDTVESYEERVSHLEIKLKKIQDYEWGKSGTTTTVDSILDTQQQYPKVLNDDKILHQLELLQKCISSARQLTHHYYLRDLLTNQNLNHGEDVLRNNLLQTLQLSNDQMMAIYSTASNENHSLSMAVIQKCLAALRQHDWLHFSKLNGIINNHKEILLEKQMKKLEAWTTLNFNVVQQL